VTTPNRQILSILNCDFMCLLRPLCVAGIEVAVVIPVSLVIPDSFVIPRSFVAGSLVFADSVAVLLMLPGRPMRLV
jgi:hypothetical protein